MNRGFQWTPHPGPLRLISEQQAADYDELGYFVLPDAVEAELLASVIAQADPLEAETEAALQAMGGTLFIARAGEITFTPHVVIKSEGLARFASSEVFRDLGHDLLGSDVRLYWDQLVYKKPGTDAPFPWHQDNGYTYVEPQQYLTCWLALTDATVETGCPWVVPGFHRQGTLAHTETALGLVCFDDWPDEAVPVEALAGDIVVFSSLTPHATGPNTSDQVRKSYIVQLAPDGAEVVSLTPDGTRTRVRADAHGRQFPILVDGRMP